MSHHPDAPGAGSDDATPRLTPLAVVMVQRLRARRRWMRVRAQTLQAQAARR